MAGPICELNYNASGIFPEQCYVVMEILENCTYILHQDWHPQIFD